jgi:predicted nucleic acid-binding protein
VTTWVVDTSPLIFLAKLGRLDLLRRAADTVCTARAVLNEIQAKPDEAGRVIEEASRSWLSIREVSDRRTVEILLAVLDLGEAEVIVLAKEVGADRVVMDDLDARRFARRAGFALVGTLGVLLAARLRGEIPSVRVEIERLRVAGFRATPSLVEAILKEAGEQP